MRLEQLLAVMSEGFMKTVGLWGEHAVLEGALQLCARQTGNALVRILLAQILRAMKKIRPAIVAEYKQRTELLQRDHPIGGALGVLIETANAEIFASGAEKG